MSGTDTTGADVWDAWVRDNGWARAELMFQGLLSLVEQAGSCRTLSREDQLGKDMRIRSFSRNFGALMSAVDRIVDPTLHGAISNLVAQMMEMTYTLGFYGPKNVIDERALHDANREQTEPARIALAEKRRPKIQERREIVKRILKKKGKLDDTVSSAYALRLKISETLAKAFSEEGLNLPSEKTIENDIDQLRGLLRK